MVEEGQDQTGSVKRCPDCPALAWRMYRRGCRWGPGWKVPAIIKPWPGAQPLGPVGVQGWRAVLKVELMESSGDKNGGQGRRSPRRSHISDLVTEWMGVPSPEGRADFSGGGKFNLNMMNLICPCNIQGEWASVCCWSSGGVYRAGHPGSRGPVAHTPPNFVFNDVTFVA